MHYLSLFDCVSQQLHHIFSLHSLTFEAFSPLNQTRFSESLLFTREAKSEAERQFVLLNASILHERGQTVCDVIEQL